MFKIILFLSQKSKDVTEIFYYAIATKICSMDVNYNYSTNICIKFCHHRIKKYRLKILSNWFFYVCFKLIFQTHIKYHNYPLVPQSDGTLPL